MLGTAKPLSKLLSFLARFSAPHVFNPWRDTDSLDADSGSAATRCRRLRQHLDCAPEYLLIGEAAGYQGCHFSGIAFTSERLVLEGMIPRVSAAARLTRRPRPWSEPSATIVWGVLHELEIADRTVLWNAFPWHPHRPGALYSNRRPSSAETQAGCMPLRAVIDHFEGVRVIAVGQIARAALAAIGQVDAPVVRHPAMAGATAFRSGLRALAGADLKGSRATTSMDSSTS